LKARIADPSTPPRPATGNQEEEAAMTDDDRICRDDVENILDEYRFSSDWLARRLGMTPRAMRRLIEKHRKELEAFGPLFTRPKLPR